MEHDMGPKRGQSTGYRRAHRSLCAGVAITAPITTPNNLLKRATTSLIYEGIWQAGDTARRPSGHLPL
jgi:hypothetical protein